VDALFAAVLVGREGRAGAVGAEEEGAEARAVVDLQHADVVVLFLPLQVVDKQQKKTDSLQTEIRNSSKILYYCY